VISGSRLIDFMLNKMCLLLFVKPNVFCF